MLIYAVLGFALLLALVFSLRAYLGFRRLDSEAREDYKYRSAKGHDLDGVSEAAYVRAYRRLHGPRGSVYAAATLLALSILTLPWLKLLEVAYEYAWRLGGQDRAYEPGYLVWQFMLFAGLIVGWSLMVYFGARAYHRAAPKTFRAELEAQVEKDIHNGH